MFCFSQTLNLFVICKLSVCVTGHYGIFPLDSTLLVSAV